MPYNLRGRSMREALLDDGSHDNFGGNVSDNETDHVSEQSESESDYSEASDSDSDSQNS